ncbi:putative polyketide synthase [Daldinia vernicosa]|uniref:putative polyketide synthase n=1 Tax=Daldinia vernicosa TaxID=114800 RepID=UPI0020084675|nr:putative polyketide synthase [Daldinia vernicosa]KAI0853135.1 putative polyketide synthase [Daldinia vernicosa]
MASLNNMEPRLRGGSKQVPIAIISMACRLPGSCNNPNEFWDFIKRGGIAPRTPPESRFTIGTHHDSSTKRNTMTSPGGMFIDADPRDLDASFFKLPKSEATAMDPQQRQLLEVVYEGLENAGLTMEEIDGQPIGCFVGSYAVDYGDIQARDPEDRALFTTLGIGRAMLSNRISHFLNIKGPSMTIDTACSGGLVAIDLANRYLQTGEISSAIVAGCNIYLSPEHVMDGLSANGTASLTGLCHSFDAKADGYVKAEAVNMVVLRRLSDAISDGNPIRGVIRGTATGSDGWTAGIASPNPAAQATVIRQAYENAGIIDLCTTSYVECHGTGTKAGDVIEANGVASVFSSIRSQDNPLKIGSVKSNIGHSEPAAGISGLLKVALAIESCIIPGNPTFKIPNPNIDFQKLKLQPLRTTSPWDSPSELRRAGVNSFGYGGSNAHVIVESWKGPSRHVTSYTNDIFAKEKTYHRPYLLAFSANDEKSLKGNVTALDKHLSFPAVSVDLRDLAYTLSEKRTRHFHRGYIITSDTEISVGSLVHGKVTLPPRIGLVFTGQGAQWPQMGKDLISSFPVAREHINRLECTLNQLPGGPQWSLLDELTQPRTPEYYKRPELSQTLVAALQLAILAVLEDSDVKYDAVIGHSSGEIVAAVAAGFLTPEQAIGIAYYRGKATGEMPNETPLGMMAVGLGEDHITAYLSSKSSIQVACINSPESITLSGLRHELTELEERIKGDGHFARMLHVDSAYHSSYMASAASMYRRLMQNNFEWPPLGIGKAAMYSSVEGRKITGLDGTTYWERNMLSPVLFSAAMQEMLKSEIDMLIEIGPSNALSAPITQIKKSVGSSAEYVASWRRGVDPGMAICNVLGGIFIRGGSVNLMHFNGTNGGYVPSVIVDLPNYRWNHSTKYWHESNASKDWRFRKFVHHDLLGSKVLGTPWQHPAWRKILRLQDIPWIRDHRLGTSIVFPAAGYLAMAIEAIFQMQKALGNIPENTNVHQVSYQLQRCHFSKAMVLEDEDTKHEILLTLIPKSGLDDGWYEFTVFTSIHEVLSRNSSGLIRIQSDGIRKYAKAADMEPFQHASSAETWYKAMREVGYTFGPSFQKSLLVESTMGSRQSRTLLSFEEPQSRWPQSLYPLHPTSIDACFQAVSASIWAGDRTAVNTRLLPNIIDELIIPEQSCAVKTALATASSEWNGLGRIDDVKAYTSNVSAFNQETHELVYEMHGLRYQSLEMEKNESNSHVYNCSIYGPDISTCSKQQLERLLGQHQTSAQKVSKLLDMIAFKKPDVRVLEINAHNQAESLWLDDRGTHSFDRNACSYLQLELLSQKDVTTATTKYQDSGNVKVRRIDEIDSLEERDNFDVLIADGIVATEIRPLLRNLRTLSYVIIKNVRHERTNGSESGLDYVRDESANLEGVSTNNAAFHEANLLQLTEFSIGLFIRDTSPYFFVGITQKGGSAFKDGRKKSRIELLNFNEDNKSTTKEIVHELSKLGWEVGHHSAPFEAVLPGNTMLVLDELCGPAVSNFTESQWVGLRGLLSRDCRVLWVSRGGQMAVTNPECGLIQGFKRSICNENPNAIIMTLDVESSSGMNTITAIDQTLRQLTTTKTTVMTDTEFIERDGSLCVERIVPDNPINEQESGIVQGPKAEEHSLFDHRSCVRLIANHLGSLDSLCYSEVSEGDIPLTVGDIEVDIYAASLNFKDLAIAMGLVPGNEQLLGADGAGLIRRCCAESEIFPIPEDVSFVEASALGTVYSTALYALTDMCNTKQGMSVLIHSAAGGVGIAAVQICKYLGAEIYATVGSDEKRQFLIENYNVLPDRIFTSRTTRFAAELMAATNGKGVDVVLNTLVGDMLDASWHCVAAGGTLVELGKKDILEKASISMEPFDRNASYRAVDMSHESISSDLKKRLLSRIFKMLEQGHIKPVITKVFGFADISAAFALLSTRNSIGKIVIARSDTSRTIVPIRPVIPRLKLDVDASYLIVGGLKGLCGSIAVYLARQGAKSLIALSRSGHQDEISSRVAADIRGLGSELTLVTGDVTNLEDVEQVFQSASKPIRGVIQGAMVLRDRPYDTMTYNEFHEAILPKVRGTWNLHHAALKHGSELDFFTLLSSICGIVGQKGQCNYSAANSFLDAFAAYRKSLKLPACSVDLGVVEDVGYVNSRESLSRRLLAQGWVPINESLLHKILYFSTLQQQKQQANPIISSQIITGIPVPLPKESPAQRDIRFSTLRQSTRCETAREDISSDTITILRNAFKTSDSLAANHEGLLSMLRDQTNQKLMRSLGMSEELDPERPLSSYGIDSLVAIEFRNWAKVELGIEIATLEVIGAKTLASLCKVIMKHGLEDKRQRLKG